MTRNIQNSTWSLILLGALALAPSPLNIQAADQNSSADKQRSLIATLQSGAPPQEKAIACKRLAVYGSKDAVAALAPLLSDPQLASWSRIALEAIPDPACDDALREALGKLQGKLLVGVINSIGVRRDANSLSPLLQKLNDPDAEVGSAAAEALGRIGGAQAANALEQKLNRTRGDFPMAEFNRHSAVAYGCVLCAEKFLAEGKTSEAIKLYDSVRTAVVPKQRVLDATRGAILARKNDGIPLLLEQLRSTDKAMFGIGLRTARELPGRQVTEALISELEKASPGRQVLVLTAIADRGDAAAMPKLLQIAKTGSTELKTTAISLMDRFADVSCVPVLLTAAAENDPELAQTAKSALARLGGKEVDADLQARIPQSSGATRQVLIGLVRQRRIESALPLVAQSIENQDPAVRRIALDTVGALGTDLQAAQLVALLPKAQNNKDRDDMETALTAICGRSGARCLPHVLPLANKGDSNVRIVALHALASIGGPEALGAVKTAVNDQDEAVQNSAIGILATWPNKWPEDDAVAEPLLALAKSGKTTSHQIQGLRGYLQYVQEGKNLKNDDKVIKIQELQPLIKTPEQKRLTISVISSLPTAKVLDPLIAYADDSAVSEEACLAIVKVATDRSQRGSPAQLRRKALQTAVEKTKNDATKQKAQEALNKLN